MKPSPGEICLATPAVTTPLFESLSRFLFGVIASWGKENVEDKQAIKHYLPELYNSEQYFSSSLKNKLQKYYSLGLLFDIPMSIKMWKPETTWKSEHTKQRNMESFVYGAKFTCFYYIYKYMHTFVCTVLYIYLYLHRYSQRNTLK